MFYAYKKDGFTLEKVKKSHPHAVKIVERLEYFLIFENRAELARYISRSVAR